MAGEKIVELNSSVAADALRLGALPPPANNPEGEPGPPAVPCKYPAVPKLTEDVQLVPSHNSV